MRIGLHESQAAFGDRFHVEQATVSRWEKGEPIVRSLWEPLAKLGGVGVAEFILGGQQMVPLLSWVAAGSLQMIGDVPEIAEAPAIPMAGLEPGEWFALRVQGDSMDRVAPDNSLILVNRSDRALVSRKFYVFGNRGEATFKRYVDQPPRLEPFSTNPTHESIFPKQNLQVIGRVRRVIIDL